MEQQQPKFKLQLNPTEKSGVYSGVKRNGQKYSVRGDRHRYFFPNEWEKFVSKINNEKHKILFLTLLHTGARIMEALHLKPGDFDFERETITLRVIKQRKAKKQFSSVAKSRTFFVSPLYLKAVKSYINKSKCDLNSFLFLNNEKLPADYMNLPNTQKRKYYSAEVTSYQQLLKRRVKSSGIADWYNFSLHNLRKTYAAYIRVYDIKQDEICYRMGHDFATFMTHYGSSMIFTPSERVIILKIFGDKVK